MPPGSYRVPPFRLRYPADRKKILDALWAVRCCQKGLKAWQPSVQHLMQTAAFDNQDEFRKILQSQESKCKPPFSAGVPPFRPRPVPQDRHPQRVARPRVVAILLDREHGCPDPLLPHQRLPDDRLCEGVFWEAPGEAHRNGERGGVSEGALRGAGLRADAIRVGHRYGTHASVCVSIPGLIAPSLTVLDSSRPSIA